MSPNLALGRGKVAALLFATVTAVALAACAASETFAPPPARTDTAAPTETGQPAEAAAGEPSPTPPSAGPTDTPRPSPAAAAATEKPSPTPPTGGPSDTREPGPAPEEVLSPEIRIQLTNDYGDANWLVFFKPMLPSLLEGADATFQMNGIEYNLSSVEVEGMIASYGGVVVDFDESADEFGTDSLGITYRLSDSTSRQTLLESTGPIYVANWSHTGILHLPVDTSLFGLGFWTLGSADRDLGSGVVDSFGNTTPRRWEHTEEGSLFQFPGVGENHAGAVDLGFTDGNPEGKADVYSFCTSCALVRITSGVHSDVGQSWTEHNIIFRLPIRLVDDDPELNGDSLVAYVGHVTSVDSSFEANYHRGALVPVGIKIGEISDRPGENRDAHVHFGVYDIDQPGDPAYPGDPNFVNVDIVALVIPSQRPLLDPLSCPMY